MAEDVFSEYSDEINTDGKNGESAFKQFDDAVDRGKEVKCEGCGGNMIFDPQTQTLKCEYCGSTIDFEKDRKVREIALEKAFEKAEKWDSTIVVRCENCGAKVVIGADEVAKECPYCGTSQIKKTEEIAGIRPNAVFPFTITADNAQCAAKKWAKRKLFAPRKFKKSIEAKNFHGVFEPGFTFDSYTFSTYNGVLGKTKTRVVGSGKNRRTETYTEWRHVSGTYSTAFDDITIAASDTENGKKSINDLLPYDYERLSVYEKKFLAGYQANHYKKDVKACWESAKRTMDAIIRQRILNKYDCDRVQYLNVSTTHDDVTYKYVLYPVYRFNYNYKQKDYDIAVNGTTGKVAGKTPVSPLRVLLAVGLGIGAVILLYILFNNGFSG